MKNWLVFGVDFLKNVSFKEQEIKYFFSFFFEFCLFRILFRGTIYYFILIFLILRPNTITKYVEIDMIQKLCICLSGQYMRWFYPKYSRIDYHLNILKVDRKWTSTKIDSFDMFLSCKRQFVFEIYENIKLSKTKHFSSLNVSKQK